MKKYYSETEMALYMVEGIYNNVVKDLEPYNAIPGMLMMKQGIEILGKHIKLQKGSQIPLKVFLIIQECESTITKAINFAYRKKYYNYQKDLEMLKELEQFFENIFQYFDHL